MRDIGVTGVQTCALPISWPAGFVGRVEDMNPIDLLGRGVSVETGAVRVATAVPRLALNLLRSEERREGKERRSRWWPNHYKKVPLAVRCQIRSASYRQEV